MRTISTSGSAIASISGQCLQTLVPILARIAANPTNPLFNHYVFESIGGLIKNTVSANASAVTSFEQVLFPVFQTILQNDIVGTLSPFPQSPISNESLEFAPYVFQLLSLQLELSPSPINNAYAGILPPLLSPAMWERKSNIPALIRVVQAYLRKVLSTLLYKAILTTY